MKKVIIAVVVALMSLAIAGCGRNSCRNLSKEVCAKAAGSVACDAAGRLTADEECADYLKNLDKFISLKNTVVTEEGVKPPAPPAPEPVVTDVVEGDVPASPDASAPAPAPAAAPAPATAQ